jgi:hypothetical protein
MSDTAADATAPSFGGLMLYEEFVQKFLLKKNGDPVGERQAQILAKEHDLPLIRVGSCVWIDPLLAADRLRQAQIFDREPRRGRGRPRKA